MRSAIVLAFAVIAISTLGLAQTPDDAIATALQALPPNLRADATVIKWKSDFTYDTLRKGTNGLVCYDRTGMPEQQPISIECTSMGNLDREAQNLKAEAVGDKAKTQAMLDAMEKEGTRVKPEYGSVWYHYMGADKDHARMHMTIALPGDGQRPCSHAHDHRLAGRHHPIDGTLRQAESNGRVAHESGH